jgi:hypothetical protein
LPPDLPHNIHTLIYAPEYREALPIGISSAAEVELRLVANAYEKNAPDTGPEFASGD